MSTPDVILIRVDTGAGTQIFDHGSFPSPNTVADVGGTIAIGTEKRQRIFVQGTVGAAVDPAIPNGVGSMELFIHVTDDTKGLQLHNASNLKLYGGEFIGIADSVLHLLWNGSTKWVEVGRNEILT